MKTYNPTKHNMKVHKCKHVPVYLKSGYKPVVYNGTCVGNLNLTSGWIFEVSPNLATKYINNEVLPKLVEYHEDVCGCKIFRVELEGPLQGKTISITPRHSLKRPVYVVFDDMFEKEFGFNLKIRCKDISTFHFNLEFHPFELLSSNKSSCTITPP